MINGNYKEALKLDWEFSAVCKKFCQITDFIEFSNKKFRIGRASFLTVYKKINFIFIENSGHYRILRANLRAS